MAPFVDHNSARNPPSKLVLPQAVVEDWQNRFAEWCESWDDSTNTLRSPAASQPSQSPSFAMNARPGEPLAAFSSASTDPFNNHLMSPAHRFTAPLPAGRGALPLWHSPSHMPPNNRVVRPSTAPPNGVAVLGAHKGRASPAHKVNDINQAHRIVPAEFHNLPPQNIRRPASATPFIHSPTPDLRARTTILPRMPSFNGSSPTAMGIGRASSADYPRTVTPSQVYSAVGSPAPGNSGRKPQNHPQPPMPPNNPSTDPIFVHYVPPKAEGNLAAASMPPTPSASSSVAHHSPATRLPRRSATLPQPTAYLPFVQVSGPTGKHECLQPADPDAAPLLDIENVLTAGSPAPQVKGTPALTPTPKRKRQDAAAADESRPRKKVNTAMGNKANSLRRQATERAAMSAQTMASIPRNVPQRVPIPNLPIFAPPVPLSPQGLYLPVPAGYRFPT